MRIRIPCERGGLSVFPVLNPPVFTARAGVTALGRPLRRRVQVVRAAFHLNGKADGHISTVGAEEVRRRRFRG